jgi:hypothetical protein
MSTITPRDLGTVITNAGIRKAIYATYVIALVLAGAIQIGFATLGGEQPAWVLVTVAVLGYLGVPVGGLALANAVNPLPAAIEEYDFE